MAVFPAVLTIEPQEMLAQLAVSPEFGSFTLVSCQVTAVLVVFVTVAVNGTVAPSREVVAVLGVTVTTGPIVIADVPVIFALVESAAVTVAVVTEVTLAGAVYVTEVVADPLVGDTVPHGLFALGEQLTVQFKVADEPLPSPITVGVSVTIWLALVMFVEGGLTEIDSALMTVTTAVPESIEFACEAAVTVTLEFPLVALEGAVYVALSPFAEIVPHAEPPAVQLTLQFTAVFDVPVTDAVNDSFCETASVALLGFRLTTMSLLLLLPPPPPQESRLTDSATTPTRPVAIRIGRPHKPIVEFPRMVLHLAFALDALFSAGLCLTAMKTKANTYLASL